MVLTGMARMGLLNRIREVIYCLNSFTGVIQFLAIGVNSTGKDL